MPNRTIEFKQDTWRKLEEFTELCPVEIACLGYAKLEDGKVIVDDVFLVPQTVSLSSVEFLDKGLPWAVAKAAEEGRLNELRFCWHSHATHDAYFSSTDKNMVRKVRDAGPIPWFASVVLNKKGKTHAQLDYFDLGDGMLADFTKQVTIPLDVNVAGVQVDKEDERVEEMEKFCERKSTTKPKAVVSQAAHAVCKPKAVLPPLEETKLDKTHTDNISNRDKNLHKKAQKEHWECFVKDNVAYYWCPETGQFWGSAPIPLSKKGRWAIPINQTVFEESEIGDEADTVELNTNEEELLKQAQERGQV